MNNKDYDIVINMEIKSIQRYIQKRGILSQLSDYLKDYSSVIILVDRNVYDKYCDKLNLDSNCKIVLEINEGNYDCIVGMGGGKIIDQVKHYAAVYECDCIIFPTSCSTDAPCTDICVVDSNIVSCGFPKMVLVDEEIVSMAPTRLLVSGIGDALSTYFESNHFEKTCAIDALSITCLQTILDYGVQAVKDQKQGLISDTVSKCIEAILYLSGTVVSNTDECLTHALALGFQKYVPQVLHGELVAYFLLVQLCIENDQKIHELKEFYEKIGLPTHLNQICLDEASDEDLEFILNECDRKLISNMNVIVSNEEIIEAIRVVDAFE